MGQAIKRRLRALWTGGIPLPEAFWWYGIALSLILNGLATIAALAIANIGAPGWLIVTVHLSPLPYNLLALVAVWRSAANWHGAPRWATLARLVIVVWLAAATAL